MQKLQLAFAILIGSLALHCANRTMNPSDGGSTITDAHADGTCCSITPQTFTLLAEADVPVSGAAGVPSYFDSPAVDVSGYRELVVSTSEPTGTCQFSSSVMFKPGSANHVYTGQGAGGGRVRVDGTSALISIGAYGFGTSCTGTIHYVISGVSLN